MAVYLKEEDYGILIETTGLCDGLGQCVSPLLLAAGRGQVDSLDYLSRESFCQIHTSGSLLV